MTVKNEHPSVLGAHHLTRENVSYTIAFLKDIESGANSISDVDWRTESGVIALQLQWLLEQLDES